MNVALGIRYGVGVGVHGIAHDSEAEDGHGKGVATIERVTAEEFGNGLVVVLCKSFHQSLILVLQCSFQLEKRLCLHFVLRATYQSEQQCLEASAC